MDPFTSANDPVADLRHRRPADHVSRTARDPRGIAKQAPATSSSRRASATPRYFGPEPEFFIFDNVRFDQSAEPRLLRGRLGRRFLEQRRRRNAEPRPQAALQGRLLPRRADRQQNDIRDEMVHGDGEGRHSRRAPAPRGGDRRSGRDRLFASCRSLEDGRRAHVVQVLRQERRAPQRQDGRRSCRSRSSATTARACTCTSRSGRARSRCSPATSTAGCPRSACTTSAAS